MQGKWNEWTSFDRPDLAGSPAEWTPSYTDADPSELLNTAREIQQQIIMPV